jgi:hypothetical protein
VFEDNVVAFKQEDTPVEFSRATSLSSLTIDDEPKISNDAILKVSLSKEKQEGPKKKRVVLPCNRPWRPIGL